MCAAVCLVCACSRLSIYGVAAVHGYTIHSTVLSCQFKAHRVVKQTTTSQRNMKLARTVHTHTVHVCCSLLTQTPTQCNKLVLNAKETCGRRIKVLCGDNEIHASHTHSIGFKSHCLRLVCILCGQRLSVNDANVNTSKMIVDRLWWTK